jgi:hypothetical protein
MIGIAQSPSVKELVRTSRVGLSLARRYAAGSVAKSAPAYANGLF